jgi:serine/threonine protein kinase
VVVTRSGIKLLDFGLATVAAANSVVISAADAQETRAMALTEPGMIVGTPLDMAPEQVEGKPTDARTDIFALGAVTYEMTTGQRPFSGDSPAGLIRAILGSDPRPISSLRSDARGRSGGSRLRRCAVHAFGQRVARVRAGRPATNGTPLG